MPASPKLTQIQEVRLPVSQQDFIAALTVKGDRYTGTARQAGDAVSRVLRQAAHWFVMNPDETVDILYEILSVRSNCIWLGVNG